MAAHLKPSSPHAVAEARRLYLDTNAPVDTICNLLGISRTTFYVRRLTWGWPSREDRIRQLVVLATALPAAEMSVAPVTAVSDPQPALVAAKVPSSDARRDLIRQLHETVSRELAAIGKRLDQLGLVPDRDADHERAARALHGLARTLREVTLIEHAFTTEAQPNDDDERDAAPRDLDGLRHALAERLEKMVAAQEAAEFRGND